MKARRAQGVEISPCTGPETRDEAFGRSRRAHAPEKTSREGPGARTKTDTGGRVEHTEAIGGTMVKELGTMAP